MAASPGVTRCGVGRAARRRPRITPFSHRTGVSVNRRQSVGQRIGDKAQIALPAFERLEGVSVEPAFHDALRVGLVRGPEERKDAILAGNRRRQRHFHGGVVGRTLRRQRQHRQPRIVIAPHLLLPRRVEDHEIGRRVAGCGQIARPTPW